MPSVKLPKKSTDTDMTPFVDVAFLILSFFMLATKFKPPEPVEITTPNSVSTDKIELKNAIVVSWDKTGRVFFDVTSKDPELKYKLISNLNTTRKLGLTEQEMKNYKGSGALGVPFSQMKQILAYAPNEQAKINQPGIPVKDSASNELAYWIRDAVTLMAGEKVDYMIKGDNLSKYPDFKNVLSAFTRNDIYKFKMVTSPEGAPVGSPLYVTRANKK
jgi:biopolymer transport protein ExbD